MKKRTRKRNTTSTDIFLHEVFEIPYHVALQLRVPRKFLQYLLWKDITEEQFDSLYQLAKEGKYGDFFYLAEGMNKKRTRRRNNSNLRRRRREDPEFRKKEIQRLREYRRNKNAMDREIQTKKNE